MKNAAISKLNLHRNWSMLKLGPKKRFPIRNCSADGVADDMALRSDCSSSVGAKFVKLCLAQRLKLIK